MTRSCRYLEGGLSFAYNAVKVCAIRHHGRGAPELANIGVNVPNLEDILEAREMVKQQNQQDGHASCRGCPNLVDSDWAVPSHPINWLGITHYLACNLSCNFCWLTWAQWSPRNSPVPKPVQRYQITPLVRKMAEESMFSPDTVIDWGGGGEPTLIPEFAWCFDFFQDRGFTQWIHTNSSRMPASIHESKSPLQKVHILTSVDAGTAETYQAIKKSDAFPKVWENLQEYKDRGAEINIKYIVTEDNCTEKDARPFIEHVKAIAPATLLLDIDYRSPDPSKAVFDGLMRLKALAGEAGIYTEFGSTGGNSAPEFKLKERLEQTEQTGEAPQEEQARSVAYERGDISGSSNKTDTTIVLTVHRAASTLLGLILDMVHENTGIPLHSQNGPYANLPHFVPKDSAEVLKDCHGMIGPLRFPVSDKILRHCNIILHLRDPRDVLVSLFYSTVYSHKDIPEEERLGAQQMGIDQFVITRAPVFLRRYERYAQNVQSHPVHLLRYEEMLANPGQWLNQFLEAFQSEDIMKDGIRSKIADLLKRQLTIPDDENIYAHVRQATPGDHERKLKPDTIAQLTERFSPACEKLGMPLDTK